MKIFILGMGHVGKALAVHLRSAGHHVTGSTTSPGKVYELEQHADHVVVLRGSQTEAVAAGPRPAVMPSSSRLHPTSKTPAP